MGVLTPRARTLDSVARPPSRHQWNFFRALVYKVTFSHLPNPSEVISKVSEPQDNF